jgi:hypothetical protein
MHGIFFADHTGRVPRQFTGFERDLTLRGDAIIAEFCDILDNYIARRNGREDVAAAESVAAITV